MSNQKKTKSPSGKKLMTKKVQGSLEASLTFLRSGLSAKEWKRNIKKATKMLLDGYQHVKEQKLDNKGKVGKNGKEEKPVKKETRKVVDPNEPSIDDAAVQKGMTDKADLVVKEAPAKKVAKTKNVMAKKPAQAKKAVPRKNAAITRKTAKKSVEKVLKKTAKKA